MDIFLIIPFAVLIWWISNYVDFHPRRAEEEEEDRKRKKKKKKERKKDAQKAERILELIRKDFAQNPYSEKMSVRTAGEAVYFAYRFENGYELQMAGGRVSLFDRNGSSISNLWLDTERQADFVRLIREMLGWARPRGEDRRHSEYREADEYSGMDPKKAERLRKLDEKIRIREEQISNMRKGDPDRDSLANELEAYRRVANKIKSEI